VEVRRFLSGRAGDDRILLLSGFFWSIRGADRVRLRRRMRDLLDHDLLLPDRLLILRAVNTTWPAAARPASVQRVVDFYAARPDVANCAGAYGV
jgi:hypothetical protein